MEMVLKLIALGVFGYTKSMWNIFDGLVVLMSIVDAIIEIAYASDSGDFTIIRSLRLVSIERFILIIFSLSYNLSPHSPLPSMDLGSAKIVKRVTTIFF